MPDPTSKLTILPMNLPRDLDITVRLVEATYIASFGSADRFHEADGKGIEKYITKVTKKCHDLPGSCVHLWDGDTIVGQAEMQPWKNDPSLGYVNTYYLIPEYRGNGFGKQIDEYVVEYLRSQGFTDARLSVSITNEVAQRFYLRQGWVNLGVREDIPGLYLMGRSLE